MGYKNFRKFKSGLIEDEEAKTRYIEFLSWVNLMKDKINLDLIDN